ncbi:MAG: sulfatase [Tannerella sp.]|jgi:arylsulfatase A-like enzyme|nr:sulfatase [Tannerella sp.]
MNKCNYISILSCVSASCYAGNAEQRQKPNIIVFIADDAGMDFGCYGNNSIKTPYIDKLASDGLRFEKAFLTSPQSSPSRTCIMTGKFAHTTGTEDLHSSIDSCTRMIPSYLKEAGYRTGVILKTHWGEYGDRQFDWVDGGKDWYAGKPLNRNSSAFRGFSDFIRNHQQPFFLWVGFRDPHRPYRNDNAPRQNNPADVTVYPFHADTVVTREDYADYYDEISRMDQQIGLMLSELERQQAMENTIIIFLSDNGMPFPRAKGSLYDTGIQTPLIISWNGHIGKGNVHNNGLISSIDLAPTLLDIAGIPVPHDMYGKSFVSILYNSSLPGRKYIYAERNWHDSDEYCRCIRSEKYKLIFNAYYELPHGITLDLASSPTWFALKELQKSRGLSPAQRPLFACPRPMIELYDLEHDPYELNNLADEQSYRETGKKLTQLLLKWQRETGDRPWWKDERRRDHIDRVTGFPAGNLYDFK